MTSEVKLYDTEVFSSKLADQIKKLILMKRASGRSYKSAAAALKQLDRFISQNDHSDEIAITQELVDKWCVLRPNERWKSYICRVSALRILGEFMQKAGLPAVIPDPVRRSKKDQYKPHIFSSTELSLIVKAAKELPVNPYSGFRDRVMPIGIRLLYLSGMRIGELLKLRIRDFDPYTCRITILGAKNDKDRIIYIHPEFAKTLKSFIDTFHVMASSDDYIFIVRRGVQMSASVFHRAFVQCLKRAGIKHIPGQGPRVHDLRHTFCVNLMRYWHQENIDVNSMLPALSAHLGHTGISETMVYLQYEISDLISLQNRLSSSSDGPI